MKQAPGFVDSYWDKAGGASTVIPGQAVGLSPEPMNTTFPSWSGLSRPSTSSLVEGRVQDVDARHKGEHDDWNSVVFMGSGLIAAQCPGMTEGR
jgi:hypothetical protein